MTIAALKNTHESSPPADNLKTTFYVFECPKYCRAGVKYALP